MSSLIGPSSEGQLFVISAPAGTGKTTLVQRLLEEFPSSLLASVSYTTRQPRPGEIEGVHYHFISESEFKAKISAEDFLEYVKLYGYYYGTSKQWVANQQKRGKHIFLVIDTQGALQLKERVPGVYIFISPPSLEVLRKRLLNRGTETSEMVEKRLTWAHTEMERIPYYDYHIVNDDLEIAYQVLKSVVIAESHRVRPYCII